jgi:hypothetical protein
VARKKDKASAGEIQRLLDERRRIEQWLARLEKAADRTPSAVRDKVRGDYEARLKTVVTELKAYEDDLRTALAEVRSRHGAFREQERQATEELSEAELRFAVGEYADAEWSEKKGGILDRLIRIREGLGQADEEISELDEVLTSITTPVGAAASEPEIEEPEEVVPPPPPPPVPPAEARVSLGSELGLRDLPLVETAPAKAPPQAAPKQAEVFGDELAFLKALSSEPPAPPARPARVSGAARAIPDAKGAPAKQAPDVEKLSDQQSVGKSRPSVVNQRTLKCGECGAMNLPTEWYCDRCGAELASL